jgi:chromosome segregation ATPase
LFDLPNPRLDIFGRFANKPMKMKALAPWLVVVALGLGLAVLYSANQKQSEELTKLRAESQELQKLRAVADDAKTTQAQSETDELARLRKDHEDLLRLRNEIRLLRDENAQLTKQLQTAQSQVSSQTAKLAAPLQPLAQPDKAAAKPLTADQQIAQAAADTFRARYGLPAAPGQPLTPEQQSMATCINNLRQIDAAKQQWAAEKSRAVGGLVNMTDLTTYFANGAVPVCPAGGAYTISPIGTSPFCNIAGHALSR